MKEFGFALCLVVLSGSPLKACVNTLSGYSPPTGIGNVQVVPHAAADAAFSSLKMWTDLSHDGISQSEELQTIVKAGIQRIDLDYRSSRRTDRYGNEFRFLSRAWKAGRNGIIRPVLTWDVFFLGGH